MYLAGVLNAPGHAEEDETPREGQTSSDTPLNPAKIVNPLRDVERVAEPKVRGGRAGRALGVQRDIAQRRIRQRALRPGQLGAQRAEKVEEAPGDDGVVVEAHQQGHNGTGQAQSA